MASPQLDAGDVKAIQDAYNKVGPIFLRDIIAIQAMAAIIAKAPLATEESISDGAVADRLVRTAQGAYLYADAMLAAREVQTPVWAKGGGA